MKNAVSILICFIVMLVSADLAVNVFAEEKDKRIEEYSERIGRELDEAIDDDTRELMHENGAEDGSLGNVTTASIISLFFNQLKDSAAEPVRILAKLSAVLVLTALVRSAARDGMAKSFTVISVLANMTIIYKCVYGAFSSVCGFLDRLSEFMIAYIPIYASVNAASGSFTAGGSYYAASLGICELIGFVSKNVIMSFLSLFMALSFTAAVNPDMHFTEAAASVKNAVKITLTALMTVFTGLSSLKSIAGSAADSAAARAVRFGASSFIPIIGSSVSEAYSTVYAGVGVIRSAVGTIGIAAAGFMLLKPIVTLILVKMTLGAAGFISDMLGLSETSELMKSMGYAMSAAISTVLCFSMMFIISTAILMLTASGSV